MKKRNAFPSVVGLVAAALLAAPAAAIVYVVPTDEALVDVASVIVYGEVQYTLLAPGEASTDAVVRVDRVLKVLVAGSEIVPGSELVVRQRGGRGVTVMGLPMLREGDRVLLFLGPGRDGVWRTVDMGLGIFFEDRGHVTRHDVPENGFRNLERFSRWIEDRAAFSLVRPADYRVDRLPGPDVVRQPYALFRAEACGAGGKYIRWRQWDAGFTASTGESTLSTKVTVLSGSLTGAEAVSETDAAASLWNGVSGSTVSVPAAMVEQVNELHKWFDPTKELYAHIGVAYGAEIPCRELVSRRLVREYDGVKRPLFLDKRQHEGAAVSVVFYSTSITDPADPYDSADDHKCVHWSDNNAGDALCPTDKGDYSPQGTVEPFTEVGCKDESNVLGVTTVEASCYAGSSGRSTQHSIPGGSGQAYRIEYAHIWIADHPLTRGGGARLRYVVAHEMGHALGIGHSEVQALMAPVLPAHLAGVASVSLTADDIAAVRALYPHGSASPSSPTAPDSDPEPSASDCTLVAPHWSGPTGGFTVRPAPGRNSVSLTCGGRTTEYMVEDGLITRLVESSCRGTGLQLTGAAVGGWYWQHGDRNAAVAPLVCSEALGGPPAVVPGGVTTEVTDAGTLIRHDTAQMIGIVPHLAGNDCGEYVTPYWQGEGGVVVRPAEGLETVRVRVQCGRTYSTMTPSAGEDGVIAELVRKSYCTDDEGNPKQGRLTVTGAAPGGWYWINGERNAAAAPLMCADLLGGPEAVDPGGVVSRATEDGTYFEHDTSRLIGVVPHLAPDVEDD